MIAHPYRVEADGSNRALNVWESLVLEGVTSKIKNLAEEVKILKDTHSELNAWFEQAFIEGALDTDWLGGGDYEIRF